MEARYKTYSVEDFYQECFDKKCVLSVEKPTAGDAAFIWYSANFAVEAIRAKKPALVKKAYGTDKVVGITPRKTPQGDEYSIPMGKGEITQPIKKLYNLALKGNLQEYINELIKLKICKESDKISWMTQEQIAVIGAEEMEVMLDSLQTADDHEKRPMKPLVIDVHEPEQDPPEPAPAPSNKPAGRSKEELSMINKLYNEQAEVIEGLNKQIDELRLSVDSMREQLEKVISQSYEIEQLNQERDKNLKRISELESKYENPESGYPPNHWRFVKKIVRLSNYFPAHMRAVNPSEMATVIFKRSGPLGPFFGLPQNLPEEQYAYEIIKEWNTYLLEQLAEDPNFPSHAPIIKSIKDPKALMDECVKKVISELGLTKDISTKLNSITEFIHKEHIKTASRSTEQSTLAKESSTILEKSRSVLERTSAEKKPIPELSGPSSSGTSKKGMFISFD